MNNDSSPLADSEVHYLDSQRVGDEFKIFVGRCGLDPEQPAAVVYVTDANGFFGGAVDIVRSMQLSRHLPPILVVGIGYRAGPLADTIAIRTRDLTPTSDPKYSAIFPTRDRMGGAPAFLSFIRDELMPWVAEHFHVISGDSVYFGHSLGGLFGTYVLFENPSTFRGYIIGSPSLWWHGRMILDVERAYASTRDDLDAAVFFGIGADETHEGRVREGLNLPREEQAITERWHLDMVAETNAMAEQLRARRYPNLMVESVVFPDEFHITVPLLTFSRGLRYMFHAPR